MIIDGVRYGWTQPICDTCFAGIHPDCASPNRINSEFREDERCCNCDAAIRNGLYTRIDPRTVDHPTPEGK